ncbi:MAG: hypothetical protein RLZZ312_1408 [Bacteroidota bacterium]|jgi:DNA-binding NarL/FixJ family response regulator
MTNPIKILLVEDHKLVREAWNLMLSSYKEFKIIGEIDQLDNLKQGLLDYKPDVILLDLNINGKLSIDYVPMICNILPNPRIIVVSMNTEYFLIKKMFQLGVKGYISKSSSSKELIEGIKTVYDKKTYTSPDVTAILAVGDDIDSKNIKLSIKDLTIIQYISDGYSNKEIADKEFVTQKSIESRKTILFKKLNVKNSPELVNFARKNGLLQQ